MRPGSFWVKLAWPRDTPYAFSLNQHGEFTLFVREIPTVR